MGIAMPSKSPLHDRAGFSATMSFGDHLEELRRRLIMSLLGIIPIFVIAFTFGRPLLTLLINPAQKQLRAGGHAASLLATGPYETFGTVIHLALVVTVVLGAPWLLFQLWLFVAPGLYSHERRFIHLLLPFSAVLTVLSMVFMYFVILPVVLAFFIGYSSEVTTATIKTAEPPAGMVFPTIPILLADPIAPDIGHEWINDTLKQRRVCVGLDDDGSPIVLGSDLVASSGIVQQYKISEYVRMVLNMALAFGIGFQMPVVVVLLGWIGLVKREVMAKYRRHAVMGCALAGALLTPADPVSMMLLAIPLYMLFELGMFILKVLPVEKVLGDLREKPEAGDE